MNFYQWDCTMFIVVDSDQYDISTLEFEGHCYIRVYPNTNQPIQIFRLSEQSVQ